MRAEDLQNEASEHTHRGDSGERPKQQIAEIITAVFWRLHKTGWVQSITTLFIGFLPAIFGVIVGNTKGLILGLAVSSTIFIWVFAGVALWITGRSNSETPKAETGQAPTQPPISSQGQAGGFTGINSGTVNLFSSAKEAPAWSIRVEPNPETSTGTFTDTRFLITNQGPIPIFDVCYIGEFWDGDMAKGKFGKIKFSFFCVDSVPRLDVGATMSAHVKLSPVQMPDTQKWVDPNEIERPFFQIFVYFAASPGATKQEKIGRMFWGQKNEKGIYIWTPAGDAENFKSTDEWPQLAPR